ncbi:MAG: phosphoribosylformylglycinamidine synthase subunit PurL [Sumerlaeia bacterium]
MKNPSVTITPEIISAHGLTEKEYARILEVLGRTPTITELGVYSVMWSEHCSYKHTRKHLATLPTKGPCVMYGPGENAGAIDLGQGIACVFKIESHNHPSAVEPFEGAATGVGGILRDIFAMGARPVALLDALRFGPTHEPQNRKIIQGVIAGISAYGNCIGVPVIGGEFSIDPCYSDNCLVNVMAIGIAKHDELMTAQAEGAGNVLLYYGNKTGRDGIHGATFASVELSEDAEEDRGCVQVGDPFMEKKILEATLELIASGKLVALQDMGAAGLVCSSTEMASKGGLGLLMRMEAVPQRADNLTAYEMLLSESQERMLAVIRPEDYDAVAAILKRWDMDAVVVGELTNTNRFVVEHDGEVVADIPLPTICDEVPIPEHVEPKAPVPNWVNWEDVDLTTTQLDEWLLKMISSPHYASKRWIFEQYDHMVQTNTVVAPGAGAGVIRVRGFEGLIAATTDGNGIWCMLDSHSGTQCVTAEAARNLVACGAKPLAVTNNLNFGSPRKPEGAYQLQEAIRGLGDACTALGTPVTGGNVSLYNESPNMAVYPTPVIGMVGLVENPAHLTRSYFRNVGDAILLIGPPAKHCGGSRLLKERAKKLVGPPLKINLEQEKAVQDFVLKNIKLGAFHSVTDVGDGGLLMALVEKSLSGPKTFGCRISHAPDEDYLPAYLSEEPSRFVATCAVENLHTLLDNADDIRVVQIGTVDESDFALDDLIRMPISKLKSAWENPLL